MNAKMDRSWLCCNHCGLPQGVNRNKKFFLTNCAHVYCENCHLEAIRPKCYVCGSPKARTLLIDDGLKREYLILFDELKTILTYFLQAEDFQCKQFIIGHRPWKKKMAALGYQLK